MDSNQPIRVLIIDDEPATVASLRELLERRFEAVADAAGDCSTAREMLAGNEYDIVTLDQRLPDIEGTAFLEELLSLDGAPPVIMVTGHGDEQTAAESIKLGASGYVIKDRQMAAMLPEAVEKALIETKLREAEEELWMSEQNYRSIFDTANDAIFIHDPGTGDILDVNLKMCEMYRCTREQACGSTVEDVSSGTPPCSQADAVQWIRRATEEGPQLFEWRARDFRGREFWVEVNLKRATIGGNDRVLAIVRDIEERKKAQEKLEESCRKIAEGEKLLSMISENLMDIVVYLDAGGTIRYLSPSYEKITGYRISDVVEGNVREYVERVHPEDREIYQERLEEVMSGPYPNRVWYRYRHARGHYLWLESVAKPVTGTSGRPDGVVVVTRDITERKIATDELKRINAELEGYAHTVSHDLKGPISSISLANHYISQVVSDLDRGELTEGIVEAVESIARNVEKASVLIEDLLALAKAGQVPAEVSEVNVAEEITRVLDDKMPAILERGVDVKTSGGMGKVVASQTHVYQLFSNLIANAIDHNTSDEPVVEISYLGVDKGGLKRYRISDNGPGIAPERLETIFLPFERGETGGTGIGLAISRKIVEIYGGYIEAYNSDGACFEFGVGDYPEGDAGGAG